MLDEAGLGPAAARRVLRAHAADAPHAARAVRAELNDAGWDAPVLDWIIALVDDRAKILDDIATPAVAPRRQRGPLA
jgi:hypothetical protein